MHIIRSTSMNLAILELSPKIFLSNSMKRGLFCYPTEYITVILGSFLAFRSCLALLCKLKKLFLWYGECLQNVLVSMYIVPGDWNETMQLIVFLTVSLWSLCICGRSHQGTSIDEALPSI